MEITEGQGCLSGRCVSAGMGGVFRSWAWKTAPWPCMSREIGSLVQMEEGQGLLQGMGTFHSPPGPAVSAGGPVSPPSPLYWAPVSSLPPFHCWWLQWGHVRGALGHRHQAPQVSAYPGLGGCSTAWAVQPRAVVHWALPPGILSPWTSLGRVWEPETVDIIVLSLVFSLLWDLVEFRQAPREGTTETGLCSPLQNLLLRWQMAASAR